ncbi:MAG: hypothetical protein JKY52_19660 [Flavobacteriales bacterium]|nr:hypothetical protein [Flavobacteriales bacterium]
MPKNNKKMGSDEYKYLRITNVSARRHVSVQIDLRDQSKLYYVVQT